MNGHNVMLIRDEGGLTVTLVLLNGTEPKEDIERTVELCRKQRMSCYIFPSESLESALEFLEGDVAA